eukprot:gnl/MRDRNA2_/MRDRNA2_80274_c0_seq2.p1 gnl/MRDRNA2_/MRDRNA2_80274_c0~~gnl/MRDRNA2_/MRDRNA2_80274_c0_seq2.p1  ORF type:complete len:314 (-),score=31.63 gnl/MRDRNA2_/MRDRNA2_80274_c0_seq2:70-1011(-)
MVDDERLLSMNLFVGDHGAQASPFYANAVGQLEYTFPLAHLLLPRELIQRRPQAAKHLRANQWRLTTHYDLHMTVAHIMAGLRGPAPHPITAAEIAEDSQTYKQTNISEGLNAILHYPQIYPFSFSLFNTTLPLGRTCADANIQSPWCRCRRHISIVPILDEHSAEQLLPQLTPVQRMRTFQKLTEHAGKTALAQINMLAGDPLFKTCIELSEFEIQNATVTADRASGQWMDVSSNTGELAATGLHMIFQSAGALWELRTLPPTDATAFSLLSESFMGINHISVLRVSRYSEEPCKAPSPTHRQFCVCRRVGH